MEPITFLMCFLVIGFVVYKKLKYMKIIETEIPEVKILEPHVFNDSRGYFFESFRKSEFEKFSNTEFVQDNESESVYGVVRGLHYQEEPYAQAKLIRVIVGEILDVAVDIRLDSPTFGKYVSVKLSASDKRQLYIPHGFAHGFAVLSETAIINYKCDNYYNPEFDKGILFNDPAINIDWGVPNHKMIISEKDLKNPLLKDSVIL